MKVKDNIRPISYIKSHAADMLKTVNTTHRPIVITQNGEARGVLLDTESFQKMTDALGILKLLSQGEKDIRDTKLIDHERLLDSLEATLR